MRSRSHARKTRLICCDTNEFELFDRIKYAEPSLRFYRNKNTHFNSADLNSKIFICVATIVYHIIKFLSICFLEQNKGTVKTVPYFFCSIFSRCEASFRISNSEFRIYFFNSFHEDFETFFESFIVC